MTNTLARIKLKGKNFEVIINNLENALKFKKTGEGDISEFLAIERIFSNSKKGEHASESDLDSAFGTSDTNEVAKKIIKQGEVQLPTEYREKQRGGKIKQIIDFFVTNGADPNGRPYTYERIESSLEEAGVNVTDKPIESQIKEITKKISKVIPIKIELKQLKITIPAQYTGQAYGIIQHYKELEEWLGNGDLRVIVNIPVGLQMEFYDKLNSITHGSALSEEIKEND